MVAECLIQRIIEWIWKMCKRIKINDIRPLYSILQLYMSFISFSPQEAYKKMYLLSYVFFWNYLNNLLYVSLRRTNKFYRFSLGSQLYETWIIHPYRSFDKFSFLFSYTRCAHSLAYLSIFLSISVYLYVSLTFRLTLTFRHMLENPAKFWNCFYSATYFIQIRLSGRNHFQTLLCGAK